MKFHTKRILLSLVIILSISLSALTSQANPAKEKLFKRLVNSLIEVDRKTRGGTRPASWFSITNMAVTETMRLEFQHALRTAIKSDVQSQVIHEVYDRALSRMRFRLAGFFRSPKYLRVVKEGEEQAGRELLAMYNEMSGVFSSPKRLLQYIKDNPWARKLLNDAEYLKLSAMGINFLKAGHAYTPACNMITRVQAAYGAGTTLIAKEELAALDILHTQLRKEGWQLASTDDAVKLLVEEKWLHTKLTEDAKLELIQRFRPDLDILSAKKALDEHFSREVVGRMVGALKKLPVLAKATNTQPMSFSQSIRRGTFRKLSRVTQRDIFERLEQLAAEARLGLRPKKEVIQLVFRHLSEQHQVLWSLAEAKFSLRVGMAWFLFWRNYIAKSPKLARRWYKLQFRSHTLLVQTRLPKDPTDVAKFFSELSTLVADAVHSQPRALWHVFRPSTHIKKSIVQHAHVLSADFNLLKMLAQKSDGLPDEILQLIAQKEREVAQLLQYERVMERAGLQGLIKAIQEAEGGFNIIPWRLGLKWSDRNWLLGMGRIPVGLRPRQRGRHFRQWTRTNAKTFAITTTLAAVVTVGYDYYKKVQKFMPPFEPEPFPGELPGSEAAYGGLRPGDKAHQWGWMITSIESSIRELRRLERQLSAEKKKSRGLQDPHKIKFLQNAIDDETETLHVYVAKDPRIQAYVIYLSELSGSVKKTQDRLAELDPDKKQDQLKIVHLKKMLQYSAKLQNAYLDNIDKMGDTIIEEFDARMTNKQNVDKDPRIQRVAIKLNKLEKSIQKIKDRLTKLYPKKIKDPAKIAKLTKKLLDSLSLRIAYLNNIIEMRNKIREELMAKEKK